LEIFKRSWSFETCVSSIASSPSPFCPASFSTSMDAVRYLGTGVFVLSCSGDLAPSLFGDFEL
jgi:hypothetical protein